MRRVISRGLRFNIKIAHMLGVKINTVDDLNKIMDIVAEDCSSSNERRF